MDALKKLCVIVPYRDREAHLRVFLPYLRQFLGAQAIPFQFLIVEQTHDKPFNRAKLLNIGFVHTKAEFDYYCFHDVDMLPVVSDYSYCRSPTHLACQVEQFNWSLPYPTYFGGVTLFDRESFRQVNGYPNEYWGWGGEDDDIFLRCLKMRLVPCRKMGKYRSLPHKRVIDKELYSKNIIRLQHIQNNSNENRFEDGLTNVIYQVIETTSILDDYIHIKVEV